jgi:hypothetical protein
MGELSLYANWHDLTAVDTDVTIGKLRAAGAKRAIPMVQLAIASEAALRSRRGAVIDFAAACHEHGIAVTLCTGPAVLTAADPLGCRDRLVKLCAEVSATPMLDAEPVKERGILRHWSPEMLRPWLTVPTLQITTTRMEAPHLGHHGRVDYAQLEGQTSTATLSQALAIHARTTDRERIVPVLGSFDSAGDPRTLAEMRIDLERCEAQARLSGALAVWVAQTTSEAECEILREWGARVFGA